MPLASLAYQSLRGVMNILVTGNMGYVGPVVVRRLRERFGSSRLAGADTGFFAHCLIRDGDPVPETLLDVQHMIDLRRLEPRHLDSVDTVVHLAGISNDPLGNAFESVTDEINHRGSVRLARLARESGVRRFVFASSCSVYGHAEGAARTEDAELNPLTAYARSKIDAETGLSHLADDTFIITCLRFPTACGMSPRLRLDLVLNDFVAAAVGNGVIRVLSDGTPWRPLIDVADMARAVEWALIRPAAAGAFAAVNVGRNEWNYRIGELAEAVRDAVPGVEIQVNERAEPDRRSYRVDFSRYAELAPEYLPRVGLERSIRELRDGLRSAGLGMRRFDVSRFVRLHALNGMKDEGRLDERLEWLS